MLNKIQYFINWLTYNPDNIPVEEIVQQASRPVFYLLVGLAMFYCLFTSLLLSEFRIKTVFLSAVMAFYTLMSLAWVACYYSDNLFVQFIPLYPLMLIWIIRKFIKTIKNRRVQYES